MTATSGNLTLSGIYAKYDLENLSVLVVESSQAGRELLASTLKDIGVGTVRKVASGLQAIEYLQGARGHFGAPANPPVDMVLTDIPTAPVDGLMLARWIRRDAKSPNHFMRVVVISGGLNIDNIRAGRNAGVNDFIAKPFTMNSLRDRINAVIHNSRPYILISNYFGPDRRRHEIPPKQTDRRTHADPADPDRVAVEKVQEETDISADARVFKIPNYLEEIISGTSIDNLNFTALKKAEAESSSWVQDYADWIGPAIAYIDRELSNLAETDERARTRLLDTIRRETHMLETTAGYLEYPLIATAAKSLARALDLFGAPWEVQSALLKSHTQAILAIARERLTGETNEKGLRIIEGLKAAKP